MRACSGQVQPVRAESRCERRIAGNENDEIAGACDAKKVLCQLRATAGVPRTDNDETAARQSACSSERTRQSFIIRHQRERRPLCRMRTRRVEARRGSC